MATGKHRRTKIVHVLFLLDGAIQTTAAINLTQATPKDAWLAHRPQIITNVTFSTRPPPSFPLEPCALPPSPPPLTALQT